jgi:toxin ParE1/3/4
MVDIRWSIGALEDIESISSYISQDYPEKASEIVKGILEKIEQLKQFPKLGRKFPDRTDERIREIIFKKYRIVYEIREEIIEILVIAHGSRLLKLY